jgi:hypothetical protein
MTTFARVGFISDDAYGTEAVHVCEDCGALVTHESRELHDLWHEHMAGELTPAPPPLGYRPLDRDEATDYVESHWDEEEQDREYGRAHRRDRD